MVDVVPPEVRSRMMSGIAGKNTHPEIAVRREMHRRGFRYRLHVRDLPGTPDIVFPRLRAVVFINGCFWHGHSCPLFRLPSTRPEFWRAKIERTRATDARAIAALRAAGWRVGVVWECALKGKKEAGLAAVADALQQWLEGDGAGLEIRA